MINRPAVFYIYTKTPAPVPHRPPAQVASRIPGAWAGLEPDAAQLVERLAARIRADSEAAGAADVGELVSAFYWEVCVCSVRACVRARARARVCVRVCA